MYNRFLAGLMICFVATLSVALFEAIGEFKRDGPVTAGAYVSGSSELEAEGTVFAPDVIRGAWDISVRAGNTSDGDSGHYPAGVQERYEVAEHTTTARAASWITGYNRHGDTYGTGAEEESGG